MVNLVTLKEKGAWQQNKAASAAQTARDVKFRLSRENLDDKWTNNKRELSQNIFQQVRLNILIFLYTKISLKNLAKNQSLFTFWLCVQAFWQNFSAKCYVAIVNIAEMLHLRKWKFPPFLLHPREKTEIISRFDFDFVAKLTTKLLGNLIWNSELETCDLTNPFSHDMYWHRYALKLQKTFQDAFVRRFYSIQGFSLLSWLFWLFKHSQKYKTWEPKNPRQAQNCQVSKISVHCFQKTSEKFLGKLTQRLRISKGILKSSYFHL